LYAFGQEITEPKNYGKLNSYIEVQGQFTSVLAGGFAAVLLTGSQNNLLDLAGFSFYIPFNIDAWNIYDIFLLDAATYLFVIILFAFIKYTPICNDIRHTEGLFNRLKGGFIYLRDNNIIFVFGLASYMLFAFTLVEIHVLLPSYVKNFLIMDGNVFASAEIYYSFGAIFSGLLILRLFKKFNTVLGVIILMVVVSCAFYLMSIYDYLWIFFLCNFIIGITNSGVRILRTTYIFNHVPNNLIGRTSSVFNTLNILVRMLLIGTFTLSFFHYEGNIRHGYLVGLIVMLLAILPLIFWYKRIVNAEQN
jgi:MFS family permease